jgi:hypothetical protein
MGNIRKEITPYQAEILSDIQRKLDERLAEIGTTRYRIVKDSCGNISAMTVRRLFDGDGYIMLTTLLYVLEVLGLKIKLVKADEDTN